MSETAVNSRHHVEFQHLFMNCPYSQNEQLLQDKAYKSLKQTGIYLKSSPIIVIAGATGILA